MSVVSVPVTLGSFTLCLGVGVGSCYWCSSTTFASCGRLLHIRAGGLSLVRFSDTGSFGILVCFNRVEAALCAFWLAEVAVLSATEACFWASLVGAAALA